DLYGLPTDSFGALLDPPGGGGDDPGMEGPEEALALIDEAPSPGHTGIVGFGPGGGGSVEAASGMTESGSDSKGLPVVRVATAFESPDDETEDEEEEECLPE